MWAQDFLRGAHEVFLCLIVSPCSLRVARAVSMRASFWHGERVRPFFFFSAHLPDSHVLRLPIAVLHISFFFFLFSRSLF